MLLVAANLLSRWCRTVTISAPRVVVHPSLGFRDQPLDELVLNRMLDADPFGDFRLTNRECASGGIELEIGLGVAAGSSIVINASGWLATVSRGRAIELPRVDGDNPLGAIAAACLGVGQVFKIAVGLPQPLWFREGIFDFFDLSWSMNPSAHPWPNGLDIGKILMVGAGSVGSSAAYCARLAGLAGSLAVVDADVIKIENFNRSPIFGRSTFSVGKAEAIARFLSGSNLIATWIPKWWNGFLDAQARDSMDFDIWLPLANEFGVRGAMQHNVPPLMIHASTTANWGVNHGRHIPGRDDCLLDRFDGPNVDAALTCAEGKVPSTSPEASVDAALPFASVLAGAVVIADLVRAQLPGYPQVPNFALLDLYSSLDVIQSWNRKARSACSCRRSGVALQNRFNGSTRYHALSHERRR